MKHQVENKMELRKFVLQILEEKIEKLARFIDFTVEASKDIKKTPKYDSIREEAQDEIYQLDKQMFELKSKYKSMSRVINATSETIQIGSVVITNKARFYISVSLGEFFYEGDRFYAISEESPMAKIMFGKKPGDTFLLNNISQTIESVM